MKSHNYVRPGKFKNTNCPYALVRGIVFSSIYEAESYCTAHKLDVNTEIEADDPRILAKCKQIAEFTLPMLHAAQERFRSNWNSLRADCHAKITARNEAQARHDMLLSMYQDETTEALGKSNGFYSGMVLLQTYITTLENVLML